MDKVGICTYYNNYNYGSYLQSFALQRIVEKLGYDTYLIDFHDLSKSWNKNLHQRTIINRLKCLIYNPKLIVDILRARKIKKEQSYCSEEQKQKFDLFTKEKLNFFSEDFTSADFRAYIVGSDQVWKVSLPGLHYVFFLRFTSPKKRISYAASIGADTIPYYNKKILKKYLNGFNSISVREINAVKLLSDLDSNLEITNVLDPVLLAGKSFWENEIPNSNISGYVLLYFLDSFADNQKRINNIISQYPNSNVLVINTGIEVEKILKAQVINPSPLEFVRLIINSQAILTDSFHGTAFSILFKKEFYTFPRNYKIYSGQKDRLTSILGMFSCSDRYIEKDSKISPIDYSCIDETLTKEREKSMIYLIHALAKSK